MKTIMGALAAMSAITSGVFAQAPIPAAAGMPLLGYVLQPNSSAIYAIGGTASRPRLGNILIPPQGTNRLYLPPGQQYVLIEKSVGEPLAIWPLPSGTSQASLKHAIPITGAMSHADLIAFSPRGEAIALFSVTEKRFQVVVNLPYQPHIQWEAEADSLSRIVGAAISDDGALLVAERADNLAFYAVPGGGWQFVPVDYQPRCVTFIPHTHSLVISDPTRDEIALLRDVDKTPIAARTLANQVVADQLAVTKDGTRVLAANSQGTILDIDLSTGVVSALTSTIQITSLSLLRDGHTLLLSQYPIISLLNAAAPPGTRAPDMPIASPAGSAKTVQLGR